MFGKIMRVQMLMIYVLGLIGCGPQVEVGYQPIGVPIRVSVNSSGEVRAGFSGAISTPIGIFDVSGDVSVNSLRNDYTNRVLIVRVDNEVVVYELEDGKEFKVDFDDSNRLYKKVALKYESNGDIILELESVKDLTTLQEPERVPQTTSDYWCDDLSGVKLAVGDRAKIVWPKVNLRSAPVVPQDFYENIVAALEEGTSLTIIGGPECAHEGTWWEVRTKDGQTGWMREYISDGYLMK